MKTEVQITCPHCRREYALTIDVERLARVRTQASCDRCGKSFDVVSRLLAARRAAGERRSLPAPPPVRAPSRRSMPAVVGPAATQPPPPPPEPPPEEVTLELDEEEHRPPPVPPDARRSAALPREADPSPVSSTPADPVAPPSSDPSRPRTWLERADPGLADLPVRASEPAEALLAVLSG